MIRIIFLKIPIPPRLHPRIIRIHADAPFSPKVTVAIPREFLPFPAIPTQLILGLIRLTMTAIWCPWHCVFKNILALLLDVALLSLSLVVYAGYQFASGPPSIFVKVCRAAHIQWWPAMFYTVLG